MPNPLVALREARNMDRSKFALALGVPYSSLASAEKGLSIKLSAGIRAGLKTIGVDSEKTAREYDAWLKQLREEAVRDALA